MADDSKPSLVDVLATAAGHIEMYIPLAGQYLKIADVGLHALAAFLKAQGQDDQALAALHAEYQRRIALADDPVS